MRYGTIVGLLVLLMFPLGASAQSAGNGACPGEDVFYDPGRCNESIGAPALSTACS